MKCANCKNTDAEAYYFHQYQLRKVDVSTDYTGTTYKKAYEFTDTITVHLCKRCLMKSVLAKFFALLPLTLAAYFGMMFKYISTSDAGYIFRSPSFILMPFVFLIPFIMVYFIFISNSREWVRAYKVCKANNLLLMKKNYDGDEEYIYREKLTMDYK